MYFDDFSARLLRKDPLPAVILFFGDGEGVLAEGFQSLKESFRRSKPQGILASFDGAENALSDVLSAAQTTSLFSTEQMIVVKRAEKLLGGHSEGAVAQLAAYFSNPNPESLLVFVAAGLKKTSKVVSALERQGWVVQCSEMPEWKMPEWAARKAQQMGLSVPKEGLQALIQMTGGDLSYVQKALEQLLVYVHPRKTASLEDVRSLSIPGGETEIFALQDAAGYRQTEKALRLLEELGGGSEGGVVILLYQRMRELLAVRLLQDRRMDDKALVAETGLHPFRLKTLSEQAGQFTVSELRGALEDLFRIQSGQVLGRLGKGAMAASVEWWLLKWGKNRLSSQLA